MIRKKLPVAVIAAAVFSIPVSLAAQTGATDPAGIYHLDFELNGQAQCAALFVTPENGRLTGSLAIKPGDNTHCTALAAQHAPHGNAQAHGNAAARAALHAQLMAGVHMIPLSNVAFANGLFSAIGPEGSDIDLRITFRSSDKVQGTLSLHGMTVDVTGLRAKK